MQPHRDDFKRRTQNLWGAHDLISNKIPASTSNLSLRPLISRESSRRLPRNEAFSDVFTVGNHCFTFEDITDALDTGYDGDVEILRPDEYDEPSTDADQSSECKLDLLEKDPPSLEDRFSGLRCDEQKSTRKRSALARQKSKRTKKKGSRKRTFSEATSNKLDADSTTDVDMDTPQMMKKQRVNNPTPPTIGFSSSQNVYEQDLANTTGEVMDVDYEKPA